ncbi:hypothetical protein GP486_003660 [Trichoglossum hirsutum]|uniref:Uncharacterized protein n=1 Tax=Trichoglossum hirsutum TaxID=265104 RepID=A0A9P8LCP3_9PEZI|nr:hypothetical protein GP486_003660 [Trichoglossum hirsutum]
MANLLSNGDDFKNAYNWTAQQIFHYLTNAAAAYPTRVDLAQLNQRVLQFVWNDAAIRPGLARYMNRNVQPAITTWRDPEGGLRPIQMVEVLSAVGYLLSETSPIKPIATLPSHGLNYCLPMLAMYAKWCITICSAVGGWAVCTPPGVVAISYVYREGKLEKVLLGVTTSGVPNIRRKCFRFRKDTVMHDVWPDSANRTAPLNDGVICFEDWGHCAETYPLYMLASANAKTKPWVYGKAMNVLSDAEGGGVADMNNYNPNEAQGYCRRACENCRVVIQALGGTVDNFSKDHWGVAK